MKIFGYLQSVSGRRRGIVFFLYDIEEISGNGANVKYWLENYTGALDDIDEGLPEPRERPLSTSMYFDSSHDYDQVTYLSVSGVVSFVGLIATIWTSHS